MLLDTYEEQARPRRARRDRAAPRQLMLHILLVRRVQDGGVPAARDGQSAERAPGITPEQREQLLQIRDRLSEPEVLAQLLQSLDEALELPAQEDLNELFDQLRREALGDGVRRGSTKVADAAPARAARERGRAARDGEHRGARAADRRRRTATWRAKPCGAPARVQRDGRGRRRSAKLTTDADVQMRLAAVQALGEIGVARRAAVSRAHDRRRSIATSASRRRAPSPRAAHRPALAEDRGGDQGQARARRRPHREDGALRGVRHAVRRRRRALLDGMLNARGLFGKQEDPELRACAAMALGSIGSEAADRDAAAGGERQGDPRAQRREPRAARRRRMTAVPERADARRTAASASSSDVGGDPYIRRMGRSFIVALYGAMRAIRLYPVENEAVQESARRSRRRSRREILDARRRARAARHERVHLHQRRRASGSTSTTTRASARSCSRVPRRAASA